MDWGLAKEFVSASTHRPSSAAARIKDSAYTAPLRWLCRSAPLGIPTRKARNARGFLRAAARPSSARFSEVVCVAEPDPFWADKETGRNKKRSAVQLNLAGRKQSI